MPHYQRRGKLPRKRHIVFKRPSGDLLYEELIGNMGFRGPSSLLYRIHRPTQLLSAETVADLSPVPHEDRTLRPHHFRLGRLPRHGDPVFGRVPVVYNPEVVVSLLRPEKPAEGYYRNATADELVYVAEGSGTLESVFGDLEYGAGDYVLIPRGIVHRWAPGGGEQRFLMVEGTAPIGIPARYTSPGGQLLEGAPFSERDIRTPGELRTHEGTGEFTVHTKREGVVTRHVQRSHPFDAVGWDGCYYPWALNIRDFEPIVGRIHQPPPVHQTFHADGFVVCSFVPRLFDFDPEAIPAPYNHSNAQSEELLFYATEEFMSRKGIEFASMTFHPDGMPHGPQPGLMEKSIGAKATEELAVMVDTFRPLRVAATAMPVDDPEYPRSWLE
jgi:homogentisate 1,2-dioxygenase